MKSPRSPLSYFFCILSKGRCGKLIASVLLAITVTSCSQLYKISTLERVNAIDTLEVLKNNKRFIIHLKDTSFVLANPSIKANKVEGNLFPLSETQLKYIRPKSKDKNPFLKEDGDEVLNQVHLYATANSVSNTANFSIPVSSISKIDINQKNVEATKRSHALGRTIAVVTTIAAVLAAVYVFFLTLMDWQ
jgi:hypothetical protein